MHIRYSAYSAYVSGARYALIYFTGSILWKLILILSLKFVHSVYNALSSSLGGATISCQSHWWSTVPKNLNNYTLNRSGCFVVVVVYVSTCFDDKYRSNFNTEELKWKKMGEHNEAFRYIEEYTTLLTLLFEAIIIRLSEPSRAAVVHSSIQEINRCCIIDDVAIRWNNDSVIINPGKWCVCIHAEEFVLVRWHACKPVQQCIGGRRGPLKNCHKRW